MELIEKMTLKAKANPQRIVLPEGTEPRTLTAADRIIGEKLAEIVLIGDPVDIMAMAKELKLENIKDAVIVNPADEAVIDRYAPLFYELRKSKGITMEEARLTTANPLYLGCLMVKAGDADGQVAGAMNTTGNVLRAAFRSSKPSPASVLCLAHSSCFSRPVLISAPTAYSSSPIALLCQIRRPRSLPRLQCLPHRPHAISPE